MHHEGFHFIDGCPGFLKGDLDEPGLRRNKIRLDRFGARNTTIETSFFRIIDFGIFYEVVIAVPIGVDIIG